jgi:hypothetical protein
VVLDTNVVVSGILNDSGSPGRVLQAALEGSQLLLITSAAILREVGAVLQRPQIARRHGWNTREITLFLARLSSISVLTPGRIPLNVVADDPSDDMFLVAALEGDAKYVVSGDRHLLSLGEYQGVAILSPAQFLIQVSLDR